MQNRVFTRVGLSECATVSYQDQVFDCQVENISLRGLFMKTSQEFPLNVPVEICVTHSPKRSLNLNAMAVRQEEAGLGMQISRMDIHSLIYLRGLLEEQCGDPELVMHETKIMVGYMLA